MRRRLARIIGVVCALITSGFTPSFAQNADGPNAAIGLDDGVPAGARLIPLAEFEELFVGKTVEFILPNGDHFAYEYYDPNGLDTVFLHWSGECREGYWYVEGDRYCFAYGPRSACWLTYELEDGGIEVLADTGSRQRIRGVRDNDPLSCEPDQLSSTAPARSVEHRSAPL